MRAAAGRPVKLFLELDDGAGEPTNADPSTSVTVDVADGAGTPVVTGAVAHNDSPAGLYSYTLVGQTTLDTFTVTWHATMGGAAVTVVDRVTTVGERILSAADIRADDVLSALDAKTLSDVLDATEDMLSDALGFPATVEGARVNFDAHRGPFNEAAGSTGVQPGSIGPAGTGYGFGGGERLIVPGVAKPLQVFSLAVNGTAVDPSVVAQFKSGMGYLVWPGGRWPSGNYDMWLSHGMPVVPGDLRAAAKKYARYEGRRAPKLGQAGTLLPERTASLTTEGGTIVFAVPTPDRPTGLPEVDSAIVRYRVESVLG